MAATDGAWPSSRWTDLIAQLRQYKASPLSLAEEGKDGDAGAKADEQGTVLQELGLSQSDTPQAPMFRPKRAAVLICLFEGDQGELRVLLTKRSSRLSSHPGEVALPGGKVEEGDKNDIATALREAKEEIGLEPSLVTVATVLEPFLSKHLLRVAPVIGILTDKQAFRPIANADEVETIFDAPLEMFLKDENRKSDEREWMGSKFVVHHFEYKTQGRTFVIWGLTASVLVRAASIVYQRPPPFADKNPPFKFPSKLDCENSLP